MVQHDYLPQLDARERRQTPLSRPWQEIIGILEGVFVEGHLLILELRIRGRLARFSFDASSPGSTKTNGPLKSASIGTRVGIITTDSTTEPFRFREIPE